MPKLTRTIGFILLLCVAVFYGRAAVYRMYPLTYHDTVEQMCGKYHIDPLLMMALIKTESNFRPDATSGKNARGLMQLRDDTARWCAEEMELTNFETDQLYIPETNIQIGTWYFHYLSDHFGGDTDLMLAAYNAGMGNVTKWLDDSRYSQDGATLTHIPYGETKRYVNKVLYHYNIYKLLYAD